MTHKGEKKHLKRTTAPKFWSIHRKESKFTINPSAGPHSTMNCIPLLIIIRDILNLADTAREAKYIINTGNIKIDGVIRRDIKYPVGLMDILEIPKMNSSYRIIPIPRKGLIPHLIEAEEEKKFKLCRIENKSLVKGGHIQLNLHDGRNIVIRLNDPKNTEEDIYKTKDVLKISVPSQEILEYIKFDENTFSLVISGRNLGLTGRIIKIEKLFGPYASTVTLESEGKTFQTSLEYAFPIGVDQSLISLPN
ncbi:MAG: 30S ribosomal protein S4e [Promethearchaeota archaeon]